MEEREKSLHAFGRVIPEWLYEDMFRNMSDGNDSEYGTTCFHLMGFFTHQG
jgi:hypothetical protein